MSTQSNIHPTVLRACVDDAHCSSLLQWVHHSHPSITDDPHTTAHMAVTPNATIAPIPHSDTPALPSHVALPAPFDLPPSDPSVFFSDVNPWPAPPPNATLPVTIVGMGVNTGAPYLAKRHTTSMADSGANVCITSDPSILVDVTPIEPIPLGVALTSSDSTSAMCTQQGFLPIPLLNGTCHYQPFLINPNATDTILSPNHVMRSSPCITAWKQSGSKDHMAPDSLPHKTQNMYCSTYFFRTYF
jgi:hypothetical protein